MSPSLARPRDETFEGLPGTAQIGQAALHVGDRDLQLARQTYLDVDEAVIYLRCPSRAALYHWADRQGIPKCRRGRVMLFLRRDLDEAVRGGLHRKAG